MKEHEKEEWNKLSQEVQDKITDTFDAWELADALAKIYLMGYEDASMLRWTVTIHSDYEKLGVYKFDNVEEAYEFAWKMRDEEYNVIIEKDIATELQNCNA